MESLNPLEIRERFRLVRQLLICLTMCLNPLEIRERFRQNLPISLINFLSLNPLEIRERFRPVASAKLASLEKS